MKPGSSIVNIASILGITTGGLPQAAYSASKAGLMALTRDLAQQWGSRKGIRVNALAPGFFKSEMTDEYKPGYIESQSRRSYSAESDSPVSSPRRQCGLPRRLAPSSPADHRGRRRMDYRLMRRALSHPTFANERPSIARIS
jgi:NAD(P)-dependent dehydrogenase (short-subunit alcohol dehydrogenase family)